MRIISFTIYYLKLRIGAWLGTHHARGPLTIKWRWQTWHRLRRAERKYASGGSAAHLRDDFVRIWRMIVS